MATTRASSELSDLKELRAATFMLKVESLRLCLTYMTAIVENRMVRAIRFHCEINSKLVSPFDVSAIVSIVWIMSARAKVIRKPAKKLDVTHGAAFR